MIYISDCLKLLSMKPTTELEKRGIFYSIQTATESMVDIIAMLVKDLGIEVKDDENNINILVKKFNLKTELAIQLKNLNGMRNILVYRYTGVDESIVFSSINEIIKIFGEWLSIAEEILNEINGY